jgi:hypothetical protein
MRSLGLPSAPIPPCRRAAESPGQPWQLIHLRNTHPAFEGTFEAGGNGSRIVLTWTHGQASAVLEADLDTRTARITATDATGGVATCEDLLTGSHILNPR